jgi:hypothetical protein
MFLEYDNKSGFYLLPENTNLYRGDTGFHLSSKHSSFSLENRPTYFTLNPESAETNYGITYQFMNLKSRKLLALDKPGRLREFYSSAPDSIQKILRENYGYKEGDKMGVRNSVSSADKTLVEYLCKKGYDGYATDRMETDTGELENEIMLCNTEDLSPGVLVTTEDNIQGAIEKHKMVQLGKQMLEKRKQGKNKTRRSRSNSPSPPFSAIPFTDFSSMSPRTPSPSPKKTVRKLAFGGNRKYKGGKGKKTEKARRR